MNCGSDGVRAPDCFSINATQRLLERLAVRDNGRQGTVGERLAFREDGHRVADPRDLSQEVTIDEDRNTALLESEHELSDVTPSKRVEISGGLFENEELRPPKQRLGEVQPLLHPFR